MQFNAAYAITEGRSQRHYRASGRRMDGAGRQKLNRTGGALEHAQYVIHGRDTKYTSQFDAIMKSSSIKPIRLPPFSANLNAYTENFVEKIKSECLNQMIFIGEKSLRHVVTEYVAYYQTQAIIRDWTTASRFQMLQLIVPMARSNAKNGSAEY
ncbi:MAG: hypothetical protein WCI51_02955 [Lentisphaerota bacterium]